MSNVADRIISPPPDDAARKARVEMLRAFIAAIPEHEREAAFSEIRDLLPESLFRDTRAPLRGGQVLNNVYELFKRDSKAVLAAPEVKEELERAGKDADIQAVRNALTYLQGRSILQRIGYGKYRLSDGSIVEGPV